MLNPVPGVAGAELGGRPRSWRWAAVRGMSDISSLARSSGRSARPMFTSGMRCSPRKAHQMYPLIDGLYFCVCFWTAALDRTTTTMTKARALYRIILRFFSENLVAFCRRVISAKRGCFQLPGLSVTAALVAAAFWGVPTGVLTAAVLDVIAVEDIMGEIGVVAGLLL